MESRVTYEFSNPEASTEPVVCGLWLNKENSNSLPILTGNQWEIDALKMNERNKGQVEIPSGQKRKLSFKWTPNVYGFSSRQWGSTLANASSVSGGPNAVVSSVIVPYVASYDPGKEIHMTATIYARMKFVEMKLVGPTP